MKYNILTVANKSYYPFLDIFLNSLFKNCDVENINKIYIVAVDLGEYKNKLLKSDKIVFIDDESKDEFSGVHSEGWYKTTKLKTHYLKQVLNTVPEEESIIMIDSDVFFLKEMSDIINTDYDIQITQMSEGSHVGASGILISHIACFMVFNNREKSKTFVNNWIINAENLIKDNKPKPHETPAMNSLLHDEEFIKDFKVESLDDRIVCADMCLFPQTKIIHFKSNGTNKTTPLNNFLNRIKYVRCFDINHMNLDYGEYINKESLKVWMNDDMNVSKDTFYNIKKQYK